jgi:monofunctional biosynthetic peptidoglycan transglycosylase
MIVVRGILRIVTATLLWVLAFGVTLLGVSFWIWFEFQQKIPGPEEIKGCLVTRMHQVELCPSSKNYIRFAQIPKHLVDAVIVSEDGTFWTHSGFDFHEIKQSLLQAKDGMGFVRGASTITQQLAKNMFLSGERTLSRKMIEGLITVRLERYLSKKEIIERYLNIVEFAEGVYGVQAAASFYFDKLPLELNLAESVFLAMVLPSPNRWNSSFFRKELSPFARQRMHEILVRLEARGMIHPNDLTRAWLQIERLFKVGSDPTGSFDPLDKVLEPSESDASETEYLEPDSQEIEST